MADDSYLQSGTLTTALINDVLDGKKITLFKPSTEVFSKKVNIKNFYNDLHDLLVSMSFRDIWTPGNHAKAGELVDQGSNFNRTGDMFETEHVAIDRGWAKELEFTWEFQKKLPESDYGSVALKINLVVRDMKDVEYLDEKNNKVKTQIGKWEFRNAMTYKNTITEDYLKKIPFVKSSPFLQKVYLDRFYQKNIENDLMACFKAKGKIYGLLHSYFR